MNFFSLFQVLNSNNVDINISSDILGHSAGRSMILFAANDYVYTSGEAIERCSVNLKNQR